MKKQKCISCKNGIMYYRINHSEVKYKNLSQVIDEVGWWCESCGEAIIENSSKYYETLKNLKSKFEEENNISN